MTQQLESSTSGLMNTDNSWIAWDRFVEQMRESGIMQSSWWAEFRTQAGYEHFGELVRQRGVIVGGAVVLRFSVSDDTCFYYVQDGPVLPPDKRLAEAVFKRILEGIDEQRMKEALTVSHLRMEPRWTALPEFVRGTRSLQPFQDPYSEPRDTLCVNLCVSDDSLLQGMKPKGRYNVRLSRKHGVTVSEDTSPQGVADFLSIYAETADRQGLFQKPDDYFEKLVQVLVQQGKGAIYFAEYERQRIATAIVSWFGKRATYLFGGSRAVHREVMAPYALHFDIMCAAREHGCEWYDLWGIAPKSAGQDHPWRDITAFKRKFGGEEVNLVPTQDLVYDQDAYASYLAVTEDPEPDHEISPRHTERRSKTASETGRQSGPQSHV